MVQIDVYDINLKPKPIIFTVKRGKERFDTFWTYYIYRPVVRNVSRYKNKRKSTEPTEYTASESVATDSRVTSPTSPPPFEIPEKPETLKVKVELIEGAPVAARYYDTDVNDMYDEFSPPNLYMNEEETEMQGDFIYDEPARYQATDEIEVHGYDNNYRVYDSSPVYIDPGQESTEQYFEKL